MTVHRPPTHAQNQQLYGGSMIMYGGFFKQSCADSNRYQLLQELRRYSVLQTSTASVCSIGAACSWPVVDHTQMLGQHTAGPLAAQLSPSEAVTTEPSPDPLDCAAGVSGKSNTESADHKRRIVTLQGAPHCMWGCCATITTQNSQIKVTNTRSPKRHRHSSQHTPFAIYISMP
jgi:hypothetical protein